MTRLQALRIEGHDECGELHAHLAGLPAAVQRLSIVGFSSIDVRSWPSAGPPATTELRSREHLRPQDVSSQRRSRGQPSGCRLELQMVQLTVVDDRWRKQEGREAVSGLLRWVRSSQAARVAIDPVSYYEEEEFADDHEDYILVEVAVEHGGHVVSTWKLDAMPNLQYLRRGLRRQCGSYGLSCASSSSGHGIWIGPAVCE